MIDILSGVDWRPVANSPSSRGLPYATHQGVLDLLGERIRVYRLSTGQAIVHADDLERFLFSSLPVVPAQFPNDTMPASTAGAGQRGDHGDVGFRLQERA